MLYKVTKNNLVNMQKVCIITIKRIDKSECVCYIKCVGVFTPVMQKAAGGSSFLCDLCPLHYGEWQPACRDHPAATKKPPARRCGYKKK